MPVVLVLLILDALSLSLPMVTLWIGAVS